MTSSSRNGTSLLPRKLFSYEVLTYIIIFSSIVFSALTIPYRIAFFDSDNEAWVIINYCVDSIFGIDIVLNFFKAYYDASEDIVDDRKKIALTYLTSWFFVDFVSIFPINQIISMQKNYSSLARIARLPKLYRLIKIFR